MTKQRIQKQVCFSCMCIVYLYLATTTFTRSSRSEQQQNMKIRIQFPMPTEHLLLPECLHTYSRGSSHTLGSVLSGILFVLFVLLYFWYSNKPGNHVLLFPGFVLSKVQRKYKKSITFSITFSMLVEPGVYFLYFFKNWGFSLVHSPAICFVYAQTQTDNYSPL